MGKDCRAKHRAQTHRKRKGFMGNLNKSVKIDIASDNVSFELPTINLNAANSTCVLEQNNENSFNLSASSRKVEDLEDTLILKPCISGYRIIDVAVLVSVFSSFLCPECGSPTLSLGEGYNKRHGLSSLLYLQCQKNPNAYVQWRNSHVCKYNYQGSAGGMEPEGAKRVFQLSIDNCQLRYIQYLGDGDSKSYMNVKNTYPDIEIEKLECVGHYQKRVGTQLRNLKKREKGLGGKGRLTDATIDRLQNFVGVAIRRNAGNLKEMKAVVLASLFHVASSKNNSLHFPHCPTDSDSWCKYNADKINKTTTYKPGPGLPMDVIMKVRYIFEELSEDSELQKSLHGKTQNANESFNRMIWDRIPKQTFVSLTQLKIGVYDAVAYFNIGAKASLDIFKELSMEPGFHMTAGCKALNSERKRNAEYRINPDNKSRRQILCAKKLKKKRQNN